MRIRIWIQGGSGYGSRVDTDTDPGFYLKADPNSGFRIPGPDPGSS